MKANMVSRAALALCFLLGGGAIALAQPGATQNDKAVTPSVPSPSNSGEPSGAMEQPMPGDHWSYEVRDDITGTLKFTTNMVITDVSPTEIAVRVENVGNPGVGFYVYDHSWNLKVSPTWKYSPNDGMGIKLPLAVGNSWRFQCNALYGSRGVSAKNVGSSKVTGQESITTDAGTFDTYKIETSNTERHPNDPTRRYEATTITWYAPSIDHWIKRISKLSSNGHVDGETSLELVDYGRR